MERQSNIDSARIEKVICVRSLFGKGTEEDPARTLFEYYTLDGRLLVRIDTWKEEQEKIVLSRVGTPNNIWLQQGEEL